MTGIQAPGPSVFGPARGKQGYPTAGADNATIVKAKASTNLVVVGLPLQDRFQFRVVVELSKNGALISDEMSRLLW